MTHGRTKADGDRFLMCDESLCCWSLTKCGAEILRCVVTGIVYELASTCRLPGKFVLPQGLEFWVSYQKCFTC